MDFPELEVNYPASKFCLLLFRDWKKMKLALITVKINVNFDQTFELNVCAWELKVRFKANYIVYNQSKCHFRSNPKKKRLKSAWEKYHNNRR